MKNDIMELLGVVLNRYKDCCNKNIKYLFSSSKALKHSLLHNQINEKNPLEKHLYQNLLPNNVLPNKFVIFCYSIFIWY